MKWGMGGTVTPATGLLYSALAGVFVKTYFVTVPSWFAGLKATDDQYKKDIAQCGGG
jgi:hypothetical protein